MAYNPVRNVDVGVPQPRMRTTKCRSRNVRTAVLSQAIRIFPRCAHTRGKGAGDGYIKGFVPKQNLILYVASQSHMTCRLVKFINNHSYKVLMINRTRFRVPPSFIGENFRM